MDGLFIDSEPHWHAAESAMMKSFGYQWSSHDQLQCLGGPLTNVTNYMSSLLLGKKSAAELAVIIVDEMGKRLSGQLGFMPGAFEFSKKVSELGLPQALVSASPRALVDCVIAGMNENFFATTVASGDTLRTKPFPDPYLHAAALLGVEIEQCIVFEDSPTGISAATASGAFVVAIPHFVEIEELPRLKIVNSFLEIDQGQLGIWSKINQHELGRLL